MTSHTKVVGSIELVDFPEFNMKDVPAKIDTGADTGALHCTKIEEVPSGNGSILRFSPFDQPKTVITADEFITKHVRSSNGEATVRYFITTTISLQGKEFSIQLSLADRTEMKWPTLIGKRFLQDNNFLVDVSRPAPVSLAGKDQI
jgi:hypothetical protein